MARIRKEDYEDLNLDELDAIEYSTETYDTYDGEVPPKDLELSGYVRKMWWTRTQNNDAMFKILWIADENGGDLEEYNGCPFWLNYALIGGAKFRWAPFMENFGLKLKDIKTIDLAEQDDQNGAPINKIGTLRPGEENDEAWCRIITDRERYNGEWKSAIKEWLPWEESEYEPEDEAEEEEPEEEPEEEEPEPEPEPAPARGRGRGTTARAARSAPEKPATSPRGTRTRTPAKEPEKAAPARGARGTRTARPAAAPARGRRARGGGDDQEPPF